MRQIKPGLCLAIFLKSFHKQYLLLYGLNIAIAIISSMKPTSSLFDLFHKKLFIFSFNTLLIWGISKIESHGRCKSGTILKLNEKVWKIQKTKKFSIYTLPEPNFGNVQAYVYPLLFALSNRQLYVCCIQQQIIFDTFLITFIYWCPARSKIFLLRLLGTL